MFDPMAAWCSAFNTLENTEAMISIELEGGCFAYESRRKKAIRMIDVCYQRHVLREVRRVARTLHEPGATSRRISLPECICIFDQNARSHLSAAEFAPCLHQIDRLVQLMKKVKDAPVLQLIGQTETEESGHPFDMVVDLVKLSTSDTVALNHATARLLTAKINVCYRDDIRKQLASALHGIASTDFDGMMNRIPPFLSAFDEKAFATLNMDELLPCLDKVRTLQRLSAGLWAHMVAHE